MISEDGVKKLASLARLEIDNGFIPVVTGHLQSIIGYFERINEVDTTGVEPMSHVNTATNVLREDIARPAGSTPEAVPFSPDAAAPQDMLPTEALLSNVPDHSGSYVRVPLIVE